MLSASKLSPRLEVFWELLASRLFQNEILLALQPLVVFAYVSTVVRPFLRISECIQYLPLDWKIYAATLRCHARIVQKACFSTRDKRIDGRMYPLAEYRREFFFLCCLRLVRLDKLPSASLDLVFEDEHRFRPAVEKV